MAGSRVPVYDTPTVQPSELPNVRADAPASPMHMASILGQQGREQENLGTGLMKAGDAAANIQVDMQEQANQVRVQDALNQTRQSALNLTFDPQNGYQSLKGSDALNRASGLPLATEYGNKLQDNINQIAEGLGNDKQRLLYSQHASAVMDGFQEGVQRHTFEQFNNYQNSVAEGAIKLGENQAGLQWNDPQAVQGAIDGVKAATYQKAKLAGVSGDMATVAIQDAESKIHSTVIDSALENNNPAYAMGYFNKNKSSMTADDILKVQGKINTQMDSHIALSTVNDTVKENISTIAPSSMDRLSNIVLGIESKGQRYDNNGNILTSPKGAKGEMQVMDATNNAPGFGVTPAKDSSPEERARVGHDYLNALVANYGGADKAMAAYNAGPHALDTAMAQAKTDGKPAQWLSYLPQETQDYVNKGMQEYSQGGGAQPMPTKLEFVNAAVGKLGDDPRPQVVKLTQEQAEKQYDLITASRKEQGENDLKGAQQALIQNGGNFAQLPAATLTNLTAHDPENYKKAQDFANSISKNSGPPTNQEAYMSAVSHPNELAAMSDTTFMQFIKTNFSVADQEKVSKLRASEMNGKADESASAINNKAVNTVLNERLVSLGINPSPDKKDMDEQAHIGGIQKFVRDDIYNQQQQIGRKMTPQEIEQRIDTLFTKQVITPGILFGDKSQPLMGVKIGDIPSADKDRITNYLKAKGQLNPSDTDVLNLYRSLKLAKK